MTYPAPPMPPPFSRRRALRLLAAAAVAASVSAGVAASQHEWLSLGAKHWAPTVISKSGIGTANAVAEARATRQAIEGWCANWSPGDKDCVHRELATPEAKKTWRAAADCQAGRITAVDGHTYALAGRWDHKDIGGGRTRWRDASGRIVGRDNASGGLGLSQQWELLCPESRKPTAKAAGAAPTARTQAAATTLYAAGQTVEARYGRDWVRGRVMQASQVRGAKGPEIAYDVLLENGKRGLLPAHMLRRPAR